MKVSIKHICWLGSTILFLFFFPFVICAETDNNTITVAADLWCPYNCDPESPRPGYMVEALKELFEEQGYRFRYMNLPWPRALREARLGRIDAVIGAARAEARGLLFPRYVLGLSETVLVARAGANMHYDGPESLKDIRLGVIARYSYDNNGPLDGYIKEQLERKSPNITEITSEHGQIQLLKMLFNNRLDAFIENRNVITFEAREMGVFDKIEMTAIETVVTVSMAFSPNKKGQQLRSVFDRAFPEYRASGRFGQILQKYGLNDWREIPGK